MFSKLTHNMYKNKKIWMSLIGVILFVIPFATHAQDTLSSSQEIKSLFNNLDVILIALQAFLWPILLLLGSLLNNDLLFSGGMQTILLNIWTAVRDFVNIMFVLGLMTIAIANIIGIGGDKVAIKTVLPKIVLALIAVNFSFLACKVVLDVVNVTSTAIFAIPIASESLKKYTDLDPAKKDAALAELSQKVCEKMSKLQEKSASTSNAFCKREIDDIDSTPASESTPLKYELTDLGKSFFNTFNSRNAALVMAIELMDIVDLSNLSTNKITGLKDLAINIIFSIIFFIIYATAFVALFAAMLVRVVVLWLAIAISPISFLGLAFADVRAKFGDDDPFFKLFMKHALIPLPVSIVLTVGMIMISQLKHISGNSIVSTDPASLGALTTGMSTVQSIIAGLATAAFIWIAAFMALKGTKADALINPIKNTVQGFGTSLAKLPLYTPILPVGEKGEKVGLSALTAGLSGPQLYINKQEARFREILGDKVGAGISKLEGATTPAQAKPLIGQIIKDSNYKPDENARKIIANALKDQKFGVMINNITLPGNFKIKDRKEFIKALETPGGVTEKDFREFLMDNQGFEHTPPAATKTGAAAVGADAGAAVKTAAANAAATDKAAKAAAPVATPTAVQSTPSAVTTTPAAAAKSGATPAAAPAAKPAEPKDEFKP